MSEVLKPKMQFEAGHRIRQVLGLGAAGLVLGSVGGSYFFTHNETTTEIAATEMAIQPNLDGMINIHSGPLPDMRMPIDSTIGVDISVGNSTIPANEMAGDNLEQLAVTYGGVAASPEGETDKIREIVEGQFLKALGVGGTLALIPTTGYLLLGAARRKELYQKIDQRRLAAIGGVAICTVASVGINHAANAASIDRYWTPLSDAIPSLQLPPELDQIEINDNAMTGAARKLIIGAVETYEKSKPFYENLVETVKESAAEFRTPTEGETVALVISDRHDNIAMDPVLRATADVAGATMVITLGDDTSSGKEWEAFSLRSLNNNFKDMTRVALGGNHDNGDFVVDTLEEWGWIVPNGEVQTVDGTTIAMANDPRKSDYTPDKREGDVPYSEATERLAELACSEPGGVDLVLTHSASMGQQALEQGCTDAVFGGHSHVYKAPEQVVGENGRMGYTVTNGTSGGAIFSFALGTSLKREANALLVTRASDGTPISTQNVRYLPGGKVMVDTYIDLFTQPNDDPPFIGTEARQQTKQGNKAEKEAG